jgi:uncharacterized membrane protein
VDGTVKNASMIVAIDTAIKTLFYFIHERVWENQKMFFVTEAKVVNDSKVEVPSVDGLILAQTPTP